MAVSCSHCQFDNPDDTLYCVKCGKTLSHSEIPQVSVTKTLETPKDTLSAGAVFAGLYEVIEEIGEGGMDKVYRACDIELDEEVALKLLKPEIYTLLGMKDEVFEHLDKEIRGAAFEPYIFCYELINNPCYDNLRTDPRFQELPGREKTLYNQTWKNTESGRV